MTEVKYFSDEIRDKILQAAEGKLSEIAQELNINLKKHGASLICDCPHCGAAKKFTVNPKKEIYGCFLCKNTGVGAVDYLIKVEQKTYPQALAFIAARYNIDITPTEQAANQLAKKISFRDEQLLASGIPNEAQKWTETINATTKKERNRYETGTIKNGFVDRNADDMILHYIGLDGKSMTYRDKSGKERNVIRVRFQNPAHHLSKDGVPMKYQSQYDSGSHLWLPNKIIDTYRLSQPIETLYVTEGEKKADKMCLHDLFAVGLMGISNLNYDFMTSIFEQVIKRCEVKRVVFVLDSDWQDIGKNSEQVDQRAKSFFSAVKKFREYFFDYKNSGFELDIFFAGGIDKVQKGIDDFLVYELKNREAELKADFEKAFIDREGKGAFVNVHRITTMSDYKLQEFWHLQDSQAFIENHKTELKARKTFKVGKFSYTYTAETDKFELVQKIYDEEKYWSEKITEANGKEFTNYSFLYAGLFTFLKNRGYGLYNLDPAKPKERYKIIRKEGKIVSEVQPLFVRHFLIDFTKEIKEGQVLEMLYRGGKQYLGPESLSNLEFIEPDFIEADKEFQYLFFQKKYWKISGSGIQEGKLEDLPKHVWQEKIIDFDAKITPPLLTVSRTEDEQWKITESEAVKKSDIYKFFVATSNFWWQKEYELKEGKWSKKETADALLPGEMDQLRAHLVCKLIAAGYTLHEFRNKAQMKAVIAMDGVESEVGKSQGGTGKSIYSTMFENLLPTAIIDGKKPRLTEDPFIYENVTENTAIIVVDDARSDLDFEFFFSQITRGADVNQKGIKKFRIDAPKFIINTNHDIKGEGTSFSRRQYKLAFSDFFNGQRTPQDYFGKLLFVEWDYEQWNLFYNLMATAIQIYLQFNDLNKFVIPSADLDRRKLRQRIGENFLDFAELYFGEEETGVGSLALNTADGGFRNTEINKNRVVEDYLKKFPLDKKFINSRTIKEKVKLYCQYKGFDFNPHAGDDGRVKRNGTEYLTVADAKFDRNNCSKIEI